MNERDVINQYVPDSVKSDIRNFQTQKLATAMTGLTDFSLEKIAGYLGGRMAARQMRWRPVADGLLALHNLRS